MIFPGVFDLTAVRADRGPVGTGGKRQAQQRGSEHKVDRFHGQFPFSG